MEENETSNQGPKVIKKSYPKFRIWDEKGKKFYFSTNTLIVDNEEKSLVAPYPVVIDHKVENDFAKNLCEFTGVLESTELQRPIYSGDIVLISSRDNKPILKATVAWFTQGACWNISPPLVQGLYIIIIGNVFEGEIVDTKPAFEIDTNIMGINSKQKEERLIN